jgi:hypothetical protein
LTKVVTKRHGSKHPTPQKHDSSNVFAQWDPLQEIVVGNLEDKVACIKDRSDHTELVAFKFQIFFKGKGGGIIDC